jgi:hypothetical protein
MPSATERKVLVVSFEGLYRPGARGNKDAGDMIAFIQEGLQAFSPDGLILDFRNLEYDYGDMMDGVLESAEGTWGGRALPAVVVTSHLNRSGLTGLVCNVMGDDAAHWLYQRMETALEEIDRRYQTVFLAEKG